MQQTKSIHMWHRLGLLTAGVALLGALGCSSSLVGAWAPTAESLQEGQFASIQFRDDGSFSAVAQREGEEALMTGKYDFDGFSLTLKPPGKAERRYKATYMMNGTLDLSGDGGRQVLKKK